MRWCIAWTAMIFLFFSVSSSKLPGYIVPAFPAMAIGLALALDKLSTRTVAWALGVNLLIAVGLWFAVPVIGAKAGAKMPAEQVAQAVPALRWQRRTLAILVLSVSALFCWDRVLNASEIFRDALSARDVIDKTLSATGPIPAETPFYSVEWLDQTAIYYLGRPMTLVSGFDELEMGAGLEPNKVIARRACRCGWWQSPPTRWWWRAAEPPASLPLPKQRAASCGPFPLSGATYHVQLPRRNDHSSHSSPRGLTQMPTSPPPGRLEISSCPPRCRQ
jgi:4-amino-4-deoxy-L-arabinose transferase-like glycosyltransferase